MDKTFTFKVNGRSQTITTDPERPLLQVLREDLRLTGTKYGCGQGYCRACTVLVNGEPAPSCVTQIAEVQNRTILTIEGLANGGALHPVQEAFLAEEAFQCGYCTPGMIMGAVGLLNKKANSTEDELVSGMQRHLCRCCNYPKLRNALRRALTQTRKGRKS